MPAMDRIALVIAGTRCARSKRACAGSKRMLERRAFTLVELLTVIAIIGVLVALLLPAVQSVRESARKTTCANNLHNHALALQAFHAAMNRFPPGRHFTTSSVEYSWCYELLPYLEQPALYARFNRQKAWSDTGGNLDAAQALLPIFRCPSAITKFPGKIDYGGITGSSLPVTQGFDFQNGVMVEVGQKRVTYLNQAEILDGTSQTLIVGECADRGPNEGGLWVSGLNCFSHDNGSVNGQVGGDISSRHPQGAFAAFADGRVQFLTQSIAGDVVGALCTRNGGETVNAF
jgi:prepilin-type N-terminal cleavage/methylation domain-containing protein